MTAEYHLKARTRFHFALKLRGEWWKGVEDLAVYIESRPDVSEDPLNVGVLDKKEISISNRQQYLIDAMRSKFEEFVLSNGRRTRYRRDGVPIEEGAASIRGWQIDPHIDVIDVVVEFRAIDLAEQPALFEHCGDMLNASNGCASPSEAAAALESYYLIITHNHPPLTKSRWPAAEPLANTLERHGLQLPRVNLTNTGGKRVSPLQPEQVGWLNYWSEATCEYLGFPQLWREEQVLRLSHRTPKGAFLVRLSQEPLDIRNPDHVRLIASAYEHLPNLGVRA